MSEDALTPLPDGDDEVAVSEEVSDPFNMSSWLGDDELILGAMGVLKYIASDGQPTRYFFRIDIEEAEAIGLCLIHRNAILDEVDLAEYMSEDD